MKKLYILLLAVLLSGCSQHDFDREVVNNNVKEIFGVSFPKSQDWCTTISDNITFNTKGAYKVQVLSYNKDSIATILNEAIVNSDIMTLYYDAPKDNLGIYLAYIYENGNYKITSTRGINEYVLPTGEFYISNIEDSYASQRGWIPGEKLYQVNRSLLMNSDDYDDEFKTLFRTLIFSYFRNGRAYNNLPLVKSSEYYNENIYPITTGDDPIIVSPVYKNDGGYKEVVNSDLYYYYFKEEDLGNDPVAYLESLPKYKAIQFDECIKADDEICKHASYALLYFEDGEHGSFQFPKGYKIGFMVRAKTTAEGGKKQGELYGDGRLNNYINNYGSFKSSKLGVDGPRAAWLSLNDQMFLCFESGTDTDFNDIILEVEGGIEGIVNPPVIDYNYYTFCYEDRRLGDYDMNDVVLKGKRINETTVEWTLMACGATDELYIKGINGKHIKENIEVHEIFGQNTLINVFKNQNIPSIVDTITVDKTFSFLINQPVIYNKTKGWDVHISKQGEDPHAIMIPYDFRWPLEQICVKDAYLRFNEWGQNLVTSTDWYKYPEEELVY